MSEEQEAGTQPPIESIIDQSAEPHAGEGPLEEVHAYHSTEAPVLVLGQQLIEASTPFVGQWRTLISTTNWEKGRIICSWRTSLESAGAEITEYSDEAWAQLVGGVTGQHVGRLRRVYQRFGEVYSEYQGLYWSHFQAACEWKDAEMWLEGALQNSWSVSQMRAQRWEVTGTGPAPASSPTAEAAIASGMADVIDVQDPSPAAVSAKESGGSTTEPTGNDQTTSLAKDEPIDENSPEEPTSAQRRDAADSEPVRPFAELPALPDDLTDAFEQFKLAILNHKLAGWAEVSRGDVLGVLESLKQLAEAPSDDQPYSGS